MQLVSSTGEPFLVLVCSKCMTVFRYNYEERSVAALIPESPRKSGQQYPIAFVFRAECVDDNCVSLVELIAIRAAGTTKEQVLAEFSKWKLDGIHCENGHPLLFPDPEKSY
jgi:hypothetical protein